MNIQEEMRDLFEDNGAYTKRRQVAPELIAEFTGKLPEFLLELWRQHGFGSWSNGLCNVCNPHDFDDLLSQIFHADDDFSHKDYHVFAYSAFGELHVWSERYGVVNVGLLRAVVDCASLTNSNAQKLSSSETGRYQNIDVLVSLDFDREALDTYDDTDKPLFARARKRLGDLEPGECYGFFPALAMGGAPRLENLKRVKALEHFAFIAQLQQFS